jgi:hypothetical protein
MRDYIFRGKHAWDGRVDWVYGSLIHVGSYCCILSPDDEDDMDFPYLDDDLGTIDGKATPVVPETVGQFTGLLDKNGTQIFEGDIVHDEYGRVETVVFIYGRYYPFNTYPEYKCWSKDDCTVIGNIHDKESHINYDENDEYPWHVKGEL